jgi:citrate lyase subunit beta/citryl-CoA lyase
MVTLVVPGSSERMLAKACGIDADEIVIDLEDAVVPERKPAALEMVVAALAAGGFAAPRISVRCNPPRTPWAHQELAALATAAARPQSVVVPKVESSGDIAFVDRLLDGAEASVAPGARVAIHALIETAAGIAHLDEITAASPRLEGLILGYADLGVSLGRSPAGAQDLDRWLSLQDAVLVAARSAGIQAIDGPYLTIADLDGLRARSLRAACLGFDGKWAIHPSQLEPIRAAFTPSDEEIARAQAVLDAFTAAASGGDGAVMLDGAMVDEPVRLAALRTLTRAGRAP